MLTFLSQNLATILISLALFAVVALVIVHLVRNRRKGKSSCGCNCAGCPMSGQVSRKRARIILDILPPHDISFIQGRAVP